LEIYNDVVLTTFFLKKNGTIEPSGPVGSPVFSGSRLVQPVFYRFACRSIFKPNRTGYITDSRSDRSGPILTTLIIAINVWRFLDMQCVTPHALCFENLYTLDPTLPYVASTPLSIGLITLQSYNYKRVYLLRFSGKC
jgi:hypothetical protein